MKWLSEASRFRVGGYAAVSNKKAPSVVLTLILAGIAAGG